MAHQAAAALLLLILLMTGDFPHAKTLPASDAVRAVYLGTSYIANQEKIAELERILLHTNANGIVIDIKDSNALSPEHLEKLVTRFKRHGIYTIARIVTFQDSYFARAHPEIAVKTSSGAFWHSGRAVWQRYWLDPASSVAQDYNIAVAKRAIDAGFHELQFDYIRFPTDGNMKDIVFPIFNPALQTKGDVMKQFFKKIKLIKSYAPQVILSIDVFGEVFLYGKEPGIGQHLDEIALYFDVISPMAYPSHYQCRAFGVQDPTAHPYRVYYETLQKGLVFLKERHVMVRPWIQDFTIPSIYGCGPTVSYTKERVRDQIRAGEELGVNGFMLWNVRNNFTIDVLK